MVGEGGVSELERLSLPWEINGAEIALSFFMMSHDGESRPVEMTLTGEHFWPFQRNDPKVHLVADDKN